MIVHRVLKKMREGGVLVPGAPAGRKGSGCFKLSAEEKERMTVAQRAAAKKLKAQQKSTLGKVNLTGCHMLVNCCFRLALRLPRRLPRRLSRRLQPRKLRQRRSLQPRRCLWPKKPAVKKSAAKKPAPKKMVAKPKSAAKGKATK